MSMSVCLLHYCINQLVVFSNDTDVSDDRDGTRGNGSLSLAIRFTDQPVATLAARYYCYVTVEHCL